MPRTTCEIRSLRSISNATNSSNKPTNSKAPAKLAATPLNPSPPATPAQLLVQTQLQSLLDQRNALESRLDDITLDQIRQPQIQELTKPYLLDSPVSPKPWRAAGAGALAGLFVAGVVVIFLVRRQPERRVG